jgi:hypothetical protein
VDHLSRCLSDEPDLPGFFANKADVLRGGFIRLNLAMPRPIIEKGLRRMTEAVRNRK